MADEWDDGNLITTDFDGGDSVPSINEVVGKSFGKGRGFTPRGLDSGNSTWEDRSGGQRGGRGGGGYRGGRGGGGRFRNDDGESNNRGGGGSWGGKSREDGGGSYGGKNRDDSSGWGGKKRDNDGWNNNSNGDGDDDRRPRGGDDNNAEGEKRPPIYVPKEISEEDLETIGIGVGINFKDYDNIKVNLSGDNAPSPVRSFADAQLRTLLLDNLKHFNYDQPTPVQKYAIPVVMNGRDLMATAQTGSGKTAAFLLPIIHCLLNKQEELSEPAECACEPRAIVLSPTRELTTQIFMEAKKFCKGSIIKSAQAYGGTSVSYQMRLMTGAHILVATPGRLGDYLKKGALSFSKIRFVVLDEADRMLDMGFKSEIDEFFSHASMVPAEKRQTLMFSATFSQDIQRLAQNYLNDYLFLAVGIVGGACKDVEQVFVQAGRKEKQKKLIEILRAEPNTKGTLVFVETKRTADFLATYLSEQDLPTTSIHGDREQRQREEALREFRFGTRDVLVATSVAARGLDIKGVKHVINYDIPKHIDDYVHRIGRTGRLGNKGKATSLYDSGDDQAIASDLVNILEQAGQSVPTWLKEGASGGGNFRESEFGGVDYRSNNSNFKTNTRNQPQELTIEESW